MTQEYVAVCLNDVVTTSPSEVVSVSVPSSSNLNDVLQKKLDSICTPTEMARAATSAPSPIVEVVPAKSSVPPEDPSALKARWILVSTAYLSCVLVLLVHHWFGGKPFFAGHHRHLHH